MKVAGDFGGLWMDGNGLAVGLQIVGHRFADATVLAAAQMFETACSWTHRRPSP